MRASAFERSESGLFRNFEQVVHFDVVHFDPEIANAALKLVVTE